MPSLFLCSVHSGSYHMTQDSPSPLASPSILILLSTQDLPQVLPVLF
jgi:hypothetical protein